MTLESGPIKFTTIFDTVDEMVRIGHKYKDGPLPGQGLVDAVTYASSQVEFYSELIDTTELLEWTNALEAARSQGRKLDRLRGKLQQEGNVYIDGGDGDSKSVEHGQALLNLSRSF